MSNDLSTAEICAMWHGTVHATYVGERLTPAGQAPRMRSQCCLEHFKPVYMYSPVHTGGMENYSAMLCGKERQWNMPARSRVLSRSHTASSQAQRASIGYCLSQSPTAPPDGAPLQLLHKFWQLSLFPHTMGYEKGTVAGGCFPSPPSRYEVHWTALWSLHCTRHHGPNMLP